MIDAVAEPTLRLGPMLRYVDHHSATVFVETDWPCQVTILGVTTPTFCVHGHHYALVILEDLPSGMCEPYEVHLDGRRRWPQPGFPPSVIRTLGQPEPTRVIFGSCRAAGPHDELSRGVDALWAHGLRMLQQDPSAWPHLLVLVGDQVYADDSSPSARRRIETRRDHDLPAAIVANFEEYTWLYQESWEPEVERWLFSVLPSAMIFDDHDMIDDWNISDRWVRDTRAEPWWPDHVIGGLVSYWVYQHLGNLSPAEIRAEGMLEAVSSLPDGGVYLDGWALSSERFTPLPGGYRFTFDRWLDHGVHLVVIDARNGRVLDPEARAMVDAEEWAWVVAEAEARCRHLLLATSLPVFVPGGIVGLQQWNEALCAGRWGGAVAWLSERLRRGLDLEGWAAFDRSFRAFAELVIRLARPGADHEPPETITVLSGDIHFMYSATVAIEGAHSEVRQVVSSPIRNALARRQERAMRLATGERARRVGDALARLVGRGALPCRWSFEAGPYFANNMGTLTLGEGRYELCLEQTTATEPPRLETVYAVGGR